MSVVSLDVVVSNLPDVLELFDRIEVHRSTTGRDGAYSELTILGDPTSAIVDGSSAGPFNLNGLVLQINLDLSTTPKVVTFEGTNPIDLQTILDQINEVVPTLASEVPTDTNRLRLTSTLQGTHSSVTVLAGAAATALGLSTTKVNGKERRIRIVDPTLFYKFYDKDGDDTFWYKTRFSNSLNSLTSAFSTPRQGNVSTVVDVAQLVNAGIALTNSFGQPVVGRRIIFIPTSRAAVSGSAYNVLPGFDSRVEVTTDPAGVAIASIVRGVTYRVIFEGTSFIREFVAPTDPGVTSFDLFSIIGTVPDPFDIVQAPIRPIKVTI